MNGGRRLSAATLVEGKVQMSKLFLPKIASSSKLYELVLQLIFLRAARPVCPISCSTLSYFQAVFHIYSFHFATYAGFFLAPSLRGLAQVYVCQGEADCPYSVPHAWGVQWQLGCNVKYLLCRVIVQSPLTAPGCCSRRVTTDERNLSVHQLGMQLG